MDRFSLFSTARSRAGFVGALLIGALVLSGILAYQAVDAGRSHEVVALKTVKEQALFAAWEFSRTARTYIADKLARPGVEVVARAGGWPGHAPLRHPATDTGTDFGKWSYGPQAAGAFFRLSLATEDLEVAGPDDPGLEAWVTGHLAAHLALDLGDRWEPVLSDPGDGLGPVVYRTLPEGASDPDLVVGFRLRPESLDVPLGHAFSGPPLMPEALTRGRSNGDLFYVSVSTADGRELWRSEKRYRSDFVATDTVGTRFAGFVTSVTVNPAVAESLIIGGLPRSRLPLVMLLMLLTVGLVAAALLQLRREAELSQLRADFVSGVSHELRTPLAQIRMFSETLLLGRVRSDEERARSLEIIANESQRLTHQVENILLYSRAERKTLAAKVEATDVCALVRDVVEAFAPLAERAHARLVVEVEHDLAATADAALVRQALLNLLDNAVKYGPSGQTVTLGGARGPDGTVGLWVEDEGPGIAPGMRRRIFEPYFRLAHHRESAVAGSGIGLSVVRQVADALRGTAHVEEGRRGGARFVLTLPAGERTRRTAAVPGPETIPDGGTLREAGD